MKVTRILVVEFVLCSIYIGYANSEDAATVSELFARNMKSKCTVSDSNNDCKNERDLGKESKENGAVMFGPRFQKVHLELPRINPVRVSANMQTLSFDILVPILSLSLLAEMVAT